MSRSVLIELDTNFCRSSGGDSRGNVEMAGSVVICRGLSRNVQRIGVCSPSVVSYKTMKTFAR